MAYRWNGVECDTFEELQRLQGSARTTSAMVKETRNKKTKGCLACDVGGVICAACNIHKKGRE